MKVNGFEHWPGLDGFWGSVTSTLDWCEENYLVSQYIAEFFNTLSNLPFILYALVGMYSVYKTQSEPRFYYCHLGLLTVGVGKLIVIDFKLLGSALFHGTLLYEMQLLDELPMIYCTCVFIYCLIQTFPPHSHQTTHKFILTCYSIIVTVVYMWSKEPVFHQVAYAILVTITAITPIVHLIKLRRLYPKLGQHSLLTRLYVSACCTYLSGFLLWNIENFHCEAIRDLRQGVPAFIAPFLQLHAWWHFLTAYGTYASIVLSHYFRCLALERKDVNLEYYWIFPLVVSSISKKKKKQ